MNLNSSEPTIIRTTKGLTISGTRITIYDILDYLKSEYPPKFIRALFNLTEAQINAALSYIEQNREEVAAEYQEVLQYAQSNRLYWEERLKEHLERVPQKAPTPHQELLRIKLQEQKRLHQLES